MLKVIMVMSVVLSMSAEALAEIRLIPIDSKSFRKCVSCHTIEEGGRNKVGPNLWNIMNRGTGHKWRTTSIVESSLHGRRRILCGHQC